MKLLHEEGIFVKQQHTFLLLLTLGLGAVIGTLNITMFNVALPTMMTYFDAPLATVQWLTSGYMLAAGMIMLPTSLIAIIIMPIATAFYPKLGEKNLMVLCIIVLLIGSAPFLTAVPTTPILFIILAMCVRSCGMGAINLVSTNAQMSSVPPELSGHASSLTNWFQQMLKALIVGIAGNIADLRIAAVSNSSPESLAFAYTSTTNLMMTVSCLLLIAVIPIALKFFRTKAEMNKNAS